MIDTVLLTLDETDFQISKPEKFDPHASLVLAYKGPFMKAIYDPRRDYELYEYLPKVTLINRIFPGGRSKTLRIEFSAPVLLYGNNFLEVTGDDFDRVVAVLQNKLGLLGIHTSCQALSSAKVSKIHYGKNFVFTDYTTPYNFIREIAQANMSKQLDIDKAGYRNAGHSLKYQNNTFALMFYDKMKDLKKAKISPHRSVEECPQPYGELQAKLEQRSAHNPLEVLRMEVQLNKRSRIKSEMKKLEIESDCTFRSLFSEKISKIVCRYYLMEIQDKLIFSKVQKRGAVVEQFMSLQRANPNVKTQFLLEYIGFHALLEETDALTARNLVAGGNQSKWQTMKNKYASILSVGSPPEINRLIRMVNDFELITSLEIG
jgi:hypothetical protein